VSPWWDGLSPAEALIECGGGRHRLRWAGGTMTAPDHGDLDADRMLAAAGGSACACATLLDAWAAHVTDLRVLGLASRGPADPLVDPGGAADRLLAGLLLLGGGLPDRLVATVAGHWAERLRAEPDAADVAAARPALTAALYGRAAAAVRAWLGVPALPVSLTMLESGSAPSAEHTGEGVALALPFSWLPEVWCRSMALVLGRFCLAARRSGEAGGRVTWELDTLPSDCSGTGLVQVELPAPG
jgi:hypothetical protein